MPKLLSSLMFSLLCGSLPAAPGQAAPLLPALDEPELAWLGERIFSNECNRVARCLTAWNEGEDFPSLGLGHFIWYRAGQQEAFTETFPALLEHLERSGVTLPAWIEAAGREQPWPDRQSFLAALDGPELQELRSLLQQTMPQQTHFIVARFDAALTRLLDTQPAEERARLERKLAQLLATDPQRGSYALIDYVHFKGDGSNPAERYAGSGWGLLQVLQELPEHSTAPLQDFVASAKNVLARRVDNAPPQRNEQRWLRGWHNRLDSYLEPRPASTTEQ
jgi:hypothetical protein